MTHIWFRDVDFQIDTVADYARGRSKALALFLKYCAGWTVTENILTSGSFVSTEATGATGAVNAPVQATGTITCDGNPNEPADNDTFTLDDGFNPATTFTFKTTPVAITDIDRSGSPSAATMSARITTAINAVAATRALWIDAADASGSVNLTNWRYDDQGNTTTTDDFTPLGTWNFSNMTSGVNGWKFTDATGTPFTQFQDEGKLLLIVDSTNPRNNGCYTINRVFDSNNIELSFQADKDAGEGFTTASGLTWYMWDKNYQVPTSSTVGGQGGANEYWRAASPHASGWSMEVGHNSIEFWIGVAADGNHGGSRLLGYSPDPSNSKINPTYTRSGGGTQNRGLMNAMVDTNGDYFYAWELIRYGPNQCEINGWGVATIDPIEPGLEDYEQVALLGSDNIGNASQLQFHRNFSGSALGFARFWDNRNNRQVSAYWADMSYYNSDLAFGGYTLNQIDAGRWGRGPNDRLGAAIGEIWDLGKTDRYDGVLIVKDPDNAFPAGGYEYIGWLKGMQISRQMSNFDRAAPDHNRPWLKHIQLSSDGVTKDFILVFDGMVFPWPNTSPEGEVG